MHEAYVNGRKASREIERVVQNIFLIKILDTIKFELKNLAKLPRKLKTQITTKFTAPQLLHQTF